jgi:hypothetical protein
MLTLLNKLQMKKILFAITLFAAVSNLSAQHTTEAEESLKTQSTDTLDGWKTGGVASLNLTQVSLTNWTAGGENSLSVNGILSLFANLKKRKLYLGQLIRFVLRFITAR